MFRIDGPGATGGNLFTEGDPGLGIAATTVTDEWLNAVQEEVANVIEGAGLTLDKADNTQLTQAIEAKLGDASGMHNEAINGGFRLWQRTGPAGETLTSVAYSPDMFRVSPGLGGSPSVTVTQEDFAAGQTDVPFGGEHYLKFDCTSPGTTGGAFLEQRMESGENFQQRQLTYSVWLRVASGTLDLTPTFRQNFGSGGSSAVDTAGSTWTVTTSWQRFSMTLVAPSTSGKTYGTGLNYASFFFIAAAGESAFELDVANWQVVRAGVPLPYRHRPLELELAMAQRYYAKSYDLDTAPGTVTDAGSLVTHEDSGNTLEGLQGMLPARMPETPAVTWYSAGTGSSGNVEYADGSDRAVSGTLGEGESMHGYPQTSGAPAGENVARGHYTAIVIL